MLGLLSGVGIPAGSIGVPPTRILQIFWPQPLERYNVLLDLLTHLRKLTKCSAAACDHEFLVTSESKLICGSYVSIKHRTAAFYPEI